MKKSFFLLGTLLLSFCTFAQVGINTVSPNARLDIRSSNQATPSNTDGVLIPIVDEFPSTPPGASQDGMLVFVSGSGTPERGLYYWSNSGATWTQFAPKADIWDVTGNSGTDGGTNNFMGTIDNQPLMFRTNNTNYLRLTTTGVLETINASQSVFIGENSSPVSTGTGNINIGYNTGNDLTTGQLNTIIGHEAGVLLTTQSNNTFLGSYTGYNTTTGTNNTLLGSGAGGSLSTGSSNTLVGLSAGQRINTGGNNTMLGRTAGLYNYAGVNNVYLGMEAGYSAFDATESAAYSNNTLVGYRAGRSIQGSNNVFLGYTAGQSETGSNRLYIENSNSTTPLIGGDFTNNRVGVNRPIGSLANTFEVGGTASKASAGGWAANSDRRLKKDIQSIDGNEALALISEMRGVRFEWSDDKTGIPRPEGTQIGFIAQELMEVFPEKVTKDKLGFYQTAYGDYDPVFVEAIKALLEKLESQENRMKALEERIQQLDVLVKRDAEIVQSN